MPDLSVSKSSRTTDVRKMTSRHTERSAPATITTRSRPSNIKDNRSPRRRVRRSHSSSGSLDSSSSSSASSSSRKKTGIVHTRTLICIYCTVQVLCFVEQVFLFL